MQAKERRVLIDGGAVYFLSLRLCPSPSFSLSAKVNTGLTHSGSIRIAYTTTKNNCSSLDTSPWYSCPGGHGGPANWPVTDWCADEFNPPDYPATLSRIQSNYKFFGELALCVRVGVAGWFCSPLPLQIGSVPTEWGLTSVLDPNNPSGICSHNP